MLLENITRLFYCYDMFLKSLFVVKEIQEVYIYKKYTRNTHTG